MQEAGVLIILARESILNNNRRVQWVPLSVEFFIYKHKIAVDGPFYFRTGCYHPSLCCQTCLKAIFVDVTNGRCLMTFYSCEVNDHTIMKVDSESSNKNVYWFLNLTDENFEDCKLNPTLATEIGSGDSHPSRKWTKRRHETVHIILVLCLPVVNPIWHYYCSKQSPVVCFLVQYSTVQTRRYPKGYFHDICNQCWFHR